MFRQLLIAYPTAELSRLSTLSIDTIEVGEYTNGADGVCLRVDRGWVFEDSTFFERVYPKADQPERRVRGFHDRTEVDPPVAEMLAEIVRRKESRAALKSFARGDRVHYRGNLYEALNINVDPRGLSTLTLRLLGRPSRVFVAADPRKCHRVVEPITGQVFRHKETTDANPYGRWDRTDRALFRYDGNLQWSSRDAGQDRFYSCGPDDRLIIEVAEGIRVPYVAPTVDVPSNKTHAGKRVGFMPRVGGAVKFDVTIVSEETARVYRAGAGVLRNYVVPATAAVLYLTDKGEICWCPPCHLVSK